MGTTFNERTWLAWLVKVRIIIITFLLGIELAVATFTSTNLPKRLFIALILMYYTISVVYAVVLAVWRDARLQARLQVLTDLAFTTAILYITGGTDTYFNFLYPLIIIVAAILLPRVWAYLTAMFSFILFGAIVELTYFDVIPSYSVTRPDPKSLQAIIVVNLFAYMAVAYLSSQLAGKLRQVNVQLQDKSGALENLQALHESIVRSMSGGLITTGLDGCITVVNPAGSRLLERSEPELVGQTVDQVFSGRLPLLPMAGPGTAHREVRSFTPSGAQKTFRVTVSALTVPDRGAMGYVYSFDDLTEIRRLEREVRMRDRMAAIGRMAAGIAHEIRNPLSSIAGSVHVLGEIAALDDEQHMLVDVVKRESERLNDIITGFLDYSREKEYHFADLDLVPLLEDTLTLLQNRPEFKPERTQCIRIVRRFEEKRAISPVDGDRIKQVFWNICDNAVRAMADGGTLEVRVRAAGDHWLITFADNGPGLPPQQFEKIFEPFQSGFSKGTGLGLAIVYDIVQAHEGKITVQSAPGAGTQFTLELKRTAEREPANGTIARSAVAAGEP